MILRVSTIVSEVYPSELDVWRLGLLEQGLDPEEISRISREMGTYVHEDCSRESSPLSSKDQMLNAVKAHVNLKAALHETGFTVDAKEVEVTYVGSNGVYVGHIDWLATDPKGQKWIIDLKTHGLWKYLLEQAIPPKLTPDKKARVNLQTWLYQLAGGDKYKNYKRGVLLVNHAGWEFIELKRPPSAKTIEHAMQVVYDNLKLYTF